MAKNKSNGGYYMDEISIVMLQARKAARTLKLFLAMLRVMNWRLSFASSMDDSIGKNSNLFTRLAMQIRISWRLKAFPMQFRDLCIIVE